MNWTKVSRRWLTLTPVALTLACAMGALRADAARVRVDWTSSADFTDVRQSMCRTTTKPEEWLGDLSAYLQRRADKVVAPTQHLDVTITDIMRAGVCEPWRGPRWDDIRVVKNIYPPRIDLRYVLTNADGITVRKGEVKLRDLAFLNRGTPNSNDPLRYEKRMLGDWLQREFKP